MIILTIPWPPSVNSVWRQYKGRILLSEVGKRYRSEVIARCILERLCHSPLSGPLRLEINAYVPDRRKRDIDNILKAPLDALTHANIWEDDSQINELFVRKCPVGQNPRLDIRITQL